MQISRFTIENTNIVLHCSIPKVGMTLPIGISFLHFKLSVIL